ncbi:glycosyltransferase family 4 protein [Aestuariivivens sediminis]|uniref:glycosyltransferase family 4 protein n=1 Tax=Aestuariivivens sediminis TaxID=2913557 RepID=UPI001F594646|nr:glycosyltransferase family 4 protein [Aestuariivivens sediminis]
MKLLLFHTYNKGYLSSFFHELSVKLTQEGHEVVCFSWKASERESIIDSVKVIVKQKGNYFSNYYNVYTIIKREKPDVILSNFSYSNPALLFGKLLGVRQNITWFHSLNEQMNTSFKNIFIKKQFLKLADTVIANSFITEAQLNKVYKVPEPKLEVVPFWTNIQEQKDYASNKFYNSSDILKIGCPGRLTTHKNQNVVIQALSRIKESQYHKFHLYFAGSGNNKNSLNTAVSNLNLSDNVSFLGTLSPEEMVDFYKSMDIIVLPSLHEAFGLVLIEALALGAPVIVSSRFGALMFIKENKGILEDITFNPESVESLVDKLIPYFEGDNSDRSCFKKLYNDNFNKGNIYFKIKSIILKD